MKENVGHVVLNYDNYSGVDLYTDGQIEDELLEIVKQYKEEDFEEVIRKRNKWPILYHLSQIRGNIVEGLPISKEDSVLEIGAGCGAVTGILADKAKKVTCIELSKKRSLINAHRNKERDNIEIIVGNFEEVEKCLEERFDYITLIGVFEYAESYIGNKEAYSTFLKIILKHLKHGGKLVIAIENKLGMKYWAGAPEDHVNKIFEGIEDYMNSTGVKTFTRKELEEMFHECGLNKYTFYYPYPDYKLPSVIYSDEYLPKKNELNSNILQDDSIYISLFNEKLAFNNIIKNDLFPIYSNSYLIVVEKDEN